MRYNLYMCTWWYESTTMCKIFCQWNFSLLTTSVYNVYNLWPRELQCLFCGLFPCRSTECVCGLGYRKFLSNIAPLQYCALGSFNSRLVPQLIILSLYHVTLSWCVFIVPCHIYTLLLIHVCHALCDLYKLFYVQCNISSIGVISPVLRVVFPPVNMLLLLLLAMN